MATTMRKVVVTAFGDTSKLAIVTAQIPAPVKDEVQVDIIYAGFSGADVNMRNGTYPMQKSAPLTPGYCFVGRVCKSAPAATKFQPGQIVAAVTVYDSDAEKINIPEKYLTVVPEGVDFQVAAALCLDWNTAYGMVKRAAKVSKGQRVFVHGLSGAVGYATMMLSQMEEAVVYGTASERNHAALRALGVHPFVYSDNNWIKEMTKLGGVHAVFDPLGFESWTESYSILSAAEPSILVGYGGNKNTLEGNATAQSVYPQILKLMAKNANIFTKKSTKFYYITRDDKTYKPELEALLVLAKDGKINVPIKHVWDMDDIKEAHDSWGKIAGMGSLVIRVARE